MNRLRWLILILGPLPIVGSSWALSAWFRSDPPMVVASNSLLPGYQSELPPGPPPLAPWPPDAALERACDEHARNWRDKLGNDCEVRVRAPFVLAGDFNLDDLDELYDETIAPAVSAMRHSYFDAEPNQPITVLVFRGEESYNRYCEKLFDERGISIYGYYKPKLRTLVLNLGTGRGTLLHELTHALASFDFAEMPDWLNEGLASLHEQSRIRADRNGPWIEGLSNWRLPGLQQVAKAGQLSSLSELLESPHFRGPDEGTNYAQARYFCLYMQEQGVLESFYRKYRERFEKDPRGLLALSRVFPDRSLAQLDSDFQAWILSLEPPH